MSRFGTYEFRNYITPKTEEEIRLIRLIKVLDFGLTIV